MAKHGSEGAEVMPAVSKVSVRDLFSYADVKDSVAILLGCLLAAGQGVALPCFAIFFGDAISASVDPNASAVDTMRPVIQDFGLLSVWVFMCGTIWQSCFAWSSERQAARLRLDYFSTVLEKDMAWFDVNQPTALPSRMVNEAQAVQSAIGPKFGMIIVGLAQFLAGLTIAYSKSWRLSLVLSSVIPLFAILGPLMAKSLREHQASTHTWYARAGAAAQEALAAIRTVAAFGGEEREANRYFERLHSAKWGGVRSGFVMGTVFGLILGCFALLWGLGFWYCANYMVGKQINHATGRPYTGGEAIMVFFSLVIGIMAFNEMAPPLALLSQGVKSYAEIVKMKQAAPRIEISRQGDALPAELKVIDRIEFRSVRFSFPSRPDRTVLQGLTCTIMRGQKVAFVGESGAGKSTIIQLIERFYDPDGGHVLANGIALTDVPVVAWRRLIGYVGQEPVLFATSVRENIKAGDPSVTDEQVEAAVKQAQAWSFVQNLPNQLDTFVGLGGGQMSGGQKQRIAIARALVKTPQLMLLDEATSALDNASEREVQATLDALQSAADGQLTTITVAHRLSTIVGSDVIFFLQGGVVAEMGSHKELMHKQGPYFGLVQAQASAMQPTESRISTKASTSNGDGSIKGNGGIHENGGAGKVAEGKDGADFHMNENAAVKLADEERAKMLAKYKPPHRKLWAMSKPEWHLMPFALIGSLLTGSIMPCMGYLFVEANGALNSYDMYYRLDVDEMQGKIADLEKYFVLLGVGTLVAEIMKYGFFSWVQEALTLRLRDQSFRALLRQHVGYFDDPENGPSRLTSMLARQALQVATLTGISLGNALATLCSVVLGLGMAFYGSWQLALVVLGVVPMVFLAIGMVMRATYRGAAGGDSKTYAAASEVSAEAILNIRTVRAFHAEGQSMYIFSEMVRRVAEFEAAKAPKKGFAFGFGNGVMFIIYIVGFGVGAQFIDSGEISFVSMLRAIMCVLFGLFGAGFGLAFAPDAQAGKQAAHAIFTLLERKSEVDAVKPVGEHRDLGDGRIVLKRVKFTYPHRPGFQVLKDVTFEVPKGKTVALCGPSGSGKSTVIQLLQRFYDPSNAGGAILVGGRDLRQFNIQWWRRQVGYVGQEPVLFDMSVEDNIKYGNANATPGELDAVAKQANLDFILQGHVKWSDMVGDRGGKLSGGQKQRVAIARALVRNPSVLLLDEATSALDAGSEHVVQQALDVAKLGRTTFVIAHRLSTIRDSDTIFVMVAGEVVEQGTHQDLMALGGVYHNLANASG